MIELHREKLVNIVANATLESRLIDLAERDGVTGYTIIDARGGGATGVQGGMFESDSNILFMMIVSDRLLEAVLTELDRLIRKGHNLVVYVSNTEVMRKEKFE